VQSPRQLKGVAINLRRLVAASILGAMINVEAGQAAMELYFLRRNPNTGH
jgi:hypothetical protein